MSNWLSQVNASPLQLELDLSELKALPLFQRDWPAETEKKIELRMKELYLDLFAWAQGGIIPKLPHGVGGLLRQSYAAAPAISGAGLEVEAVWGSDSTYARFVEEGTGPAAGHDRYWPPWRALELWVVKILGVAFEDAEEAAKGVARGIFWHGTEAQPVVADWFAANKDVLIEKMKVALEELFTEATLGESQA